MIWIWNNPKSLPGKRMGEYVKNSGTDRFEFRKVAKMDINSVLPPKVVFECEEKHITDILPNSGFLIIVSAKVLNILNEMCPNDFQAFEANVFVRDKKINNYYLINVLYEVEVIDKEKSIYSLITGTNAIRGFEKIVFKKVSLDGHEIVRNADYRSHVLVSDRLKEAFEKAKIKGVEFRQEP